MATSLAEISFRPLKPCHTLYFWFKFAQMGDIRLSLREGSMLPSKLIFLYLWTIRTKIQSLRTAVMSFTTIWLLFSKVKKFYYLRLRDELSHIRTIRSWMNCLATFQLQMRTLPCGGFCHCLNSVQSSPQREVNWHQWFQNFFAIQR